MALASVRDPWMEMGKDVEREIDKLMKRRRRG